MRQPLITLKHFMAKNTIDIELLKTEASYQCALKPASHGLDHSPAAGSALDAEFELLMMMVKCYKAKYIVV